MSSDTKAVLDETKALKKSLDDATPVLKEALPALKDFQRWVNLPDHQGKSLPKLFASVRDDKEEGRMGFKSFSHFLREVHAAGPSVNQGSFSVGNIQSPVLKSWATHPIYAKAASGLNETVGAEGGFLVPPTFANELLMRTYENDLLQRVDMRTTTGNDLSIPAIDETSRVDGSRFGGVRMYWESEAAQMTTTKPAYNRVQLHLHKLMGISYATDELLADSGIAIEQHLFKVFGMEMQFKLGDSLINGTGSGMPQGILNAPATVSVSKETGQAAATILFENINKMWGRMYAPSRKNAVWLINQDVEQQLQTMVVNQAGIAFPAYLPPGGASEKPYATLKGVPVMPVEFCQTLGTVGDIILCDLSQYIGLRRQEAEQATSIHLRFDFGETAFRIVMRADARPWWTAPLTPFHGSNTQSPFIVLATRS